MGNLQADAGSSLVANHITLGGLVIGGTADVPAMVTIAASDASGNPLASSTAAASNSAIALTTSTLSSTSNISAGTFTPGRLATLIAKRLAQRVATTTAQVSLARISEVAAVSATPQAIAPSASATAAIPQLTVAQPIVTVASHYAVLPVTVRAGIDAQSNSGNGVLIAAGLQRTLDAPELTPGSAAASQQQSEAVSQSTMISAFQAMPISPAKLRQLDAAFALEFSGRDSVQWGNSGSANTGNGETGLDSEDLAIVDELLDSRSADFWNRG
jgi:hypothetical protein